MFFLKSHKNRNYNKNQNTRYTRKGNNRGITPNYKQLGPTFNSHMPATQTRSRINSYTKGSKGLISLLSNNFRKRKIVLIGVVCLLMSCSVGLILAISSSTPFSILGVQFGQMPPQAILDLQLTSNPVGTEVYLTMPQYNQGKETPLGTTPLHVKLPAGKAKLVFSKDGYTDYTTELEVKGQLIVKPASQGNHTTSSEIASTVENNHAGSSSTSNTGATSESNTKSNSLPSYNLAAVLWPSQANLRQIVPPIPNSHLVYSRFLSSNSRYLELTVLPTNNTGGRTVLSSAGMEGLPTDLWLYDTHNDSATQPVLLSYPALNAVSNYYFGSVSDQSIMTTTATTSQNNNPIANLALIAPTLSPDATNLAFVSHNLNPINPDKGDSSSNLPPTWDNEAVWVVPVATTQSMTGARIAGPTTTVGNGNALAPVELFNLRDLLTLMPAFASNSYSTAASDNTNTPFLNNQRFAQIKQLYWSPTSTSLLAVIKVYAGVNGTSLDATEGTTVLVVINVGSHTPTGAATLVTPQPLPISILPGTVVWSGDEQAIAFLVEKQDQNASSRASLCVLDLLQATQTKDSVSSSPSAGSSSTTSPFLLYSTSFRYLGDVVGSGMWQDSSDTSDSAITNPGVYPPAYSNIRYNPFSWPKITNPILTNQNSTNQGVINTGNPSISQPTNTPFLSSSWGIYGSMSPEQDAASNIAGGSDNSVDTLFAYSRFLQTGSQTITATTDPSSATPTQADSSLLLLQPKQLESQSGGSGNNKTNKTSSDKANNILRQDSYPLWLLTGGAQFGNEGGNAKTTSGKDETPNSTNNQALPTNNVLYFSSQLVSYGSKGGGFLGGSHANTTYQLSVNELSLTNLSDSDSVANSSATTDSQINSDLPSQMTSDRTTIQMVGQGITVEILSAKHEPVTLPLSYSSAVSQLNFEASWRPDGQAALIVAPTDQQLADTSASKEAEFDDTGAGEIWLATWQLQPESY